MVVRTGCFCAGRGTADAAVTAVGMTVPPRLVNVGFEDLGVFRKRGAKGLFWQGGEERAQA